ncbi:MAG: penicillin-binding protein 1C [Ignavibacteriae bacterium]|nr:penicillin-binding protein 1C [Ignavibacteriota bacterium]
MRRKLFRWLAFVAVGLLTGVVLLNALLPLPPAKPYSLVVTDRNGKLLQVFLAEDGIWRVRTHPDEIPAKLKHILIQKEDRFFYEHPGINPFSLVRALVQNVTSGKRISGASTITMQVARMLEPKERTYSGKIVEMFRAVQLELRYSKEEILELYLSLVPLGGNIEGLKSASLLYYQTPPERLNIAQLFDLILIPNNPNRLRPDRNPERLLQVRKQKALPFIQKGLFTKQDSVIIWQTTSSALRQQPHRRAPHFCLRIQEQFVNNDEVKTSLNLDMQETVEVLLSNHLRSWKQKGVMNGAALVVNNRTREILVYIGSENFDDANAHGQVDAIKALRSPGSTMKPLLYAMLMDKGTLTPKSRLLDTPYDAEGFFAENYDGNYSGLVYADEALRRSLNVPMIRLLKESGVENFVRFASGAGILSLQKQKEQLGLSVILGGCGVTLEELVTAYSTFPNSGIYSPLNYEKTQISKHKSQITNPQSGFKAFSSSASSMVTTILSSLDRPDLPNNFESSVNLPKVAFKTGTSYGRHDAWCVGYSAEFTVGVWIGNVTHKGNPELTGARAAAPLLIDIFNSISSSNEKTIMKQPSDVLTREVCANSGLLPTQRCEHIIEDLYSVRHTLERSCEFDKEILVSLDGTTQYCPSCLGTNRYNVNVFPNYPPELLSFWNQTGTTYTAIPEHNANCTQVFAGEGPKILSPSDAMTYFLVSPKQNITLEASSGLDVQEHIWYVDERFLKRDKANGKVFVPFPVGEHTISCVDDRGRISSVKISVQNY